MIDQSDYEKLLGPRMPQDLLDGNEMSRAFGQLCSNKYTGDIKDVIKMSHDPRVDLSYNDSVCFGWAAGYGHLDIVKYLSTHEHIDPYAVDCRAVFWSIDSNRVEVTKFIIGLPLFDLDKYLMFYDKKWNILTTLAYRKNYDMLNLLTGYKSFI